MEKTTVDFDIISSDVSKFMEEFLPEMLIRKESLLLRVKGFSNFANILQVAPEDFFPAAEAFFEGKHDYQKGYSLNDSEWKMYSMMLDIYAGKWNVKNCPRAYDMNLWRIWLKAYVSEIKEKVP